MNIIYGNKEYFPGIGKIAYEGPDSDNPLAFKYYDEHRLVAGKTMKDHFKFATCYWHSFCGAGHDPFGPGTKVFPWMATSDAVARAQEKMDAAFEFFTKIGTPYYCFHDIDLIDGDGFELLDKFSSKTFHTIFIPLFSFLKITLIITIITIIIIFITTISIIIIFTHFHNAP